MSRKKELLIDLTPLLDVILIILFLVLITSGEKAQQKTKEEQRHYKEEIFKLEERLREQSQQISDLGEEKASLASSLDLQKKRTGLTDDQAQAIDGLLKEVSIFILEIPADYPETKLELTVNGEDTLVKPKDQDLYSWLSERIKPAESQVKVIVLKYPGDKILWRDYNTIRQTIKRLDQGQEKFLFQEEDTQKRSSSISE